ncbi:hypothetical protein [Kordiimonas sediminis]|nr:hypothetical protein [Kordiimonas sediminis]
MKRTIDVGWVIKTQKTDIMWYEPEPFRQNVPVNPNAKSVQKCPSAIDFDNRHFVVKCPYDLHLRIGKTADGKPQLLNVQGNNSAVRPSVMNQIMMLHPQEEWRHPERPLLQFVTPYILVADDPVWVNQLPPYLDFLKTHRPGVMVSGRFPAHLWPRPFMWAFEWHDINSDLILRRGEPWFYLRFETEDPTMNIRMVEAEWTEEVAAFAQSILDVSNFTNRTYSLFRAAESKRPINLLKPKASSKT